MAVGLVTAELHQDIDKVKVMSLKELFVWAKIAAGMSGRKFE